MDVDPFKVLAAIGTLFTIGDKLYTYVKKWRESRAVSKKALNVAPLNLFNKKTYESNQSGTLLTPGYPVSVNFRSICTLARPLELLKQRFGRMNRHSLIPQ